MPSDMSETKGALDRDLTLAGQELTQIKDADSSTIMAKSVAEMTIYDFEEFWVVRDRPPYFV